MLINVMLDEGAYMPEKAHSVDAGFDLKTPVDVCIPARSSAKIDLGVHIEIPKGYVGFLKSKSGLNVNKDLTCEGVIDCGYTGSIVAKIYNDANTNYYFNKGQKVTQIVFLPIPIVELKQVKSLLNTERGDNGFGSTGA